MYHLLDIIADTNFQSVINMLPLMCLKDVINTKGLSRSIHKRWL